MQIVQVPIHVLIIEDNPGDAVLFREVLNETSIELKKVSHVMDLDRAIEYLQTQQPDIIFLDLSLPDCSGIETFYKLQQYTGKAAVVILTGINDTNVALQAINKGAQDFLIKGELNEVIIKKTVLYSIERQRISESLRLSNERYNMVALATNDMAWDWDLRTNKIFRSKAGWDKIIGPVREEEYNQPDALWHRMLPEEKIRNDKEMSEMLNSPDSTNFQMEYRIQRTDGTFAHIIDKGYIIREENGMVARLIGAIQDVTEIKKAEEELRRLSFVAQETINGIVITNQENTITWVNESLPKITGFSREDIVGNSMVDFLARLSATPVTIRYIRIKMKLEQTYSCDLLIRKQNGERCWLRMQCQPQHDAHQQVTGFFAIVTDISREKFVEETLKASENRFRSIIEKSTEGLTLLNIDGIVTDTSPAAIKMTGFSIEDYSQPENKNLVHPHEMEAVNKAFEDVLQKPGLVKTLEYRFRNKLGYYIWLEATYHNLLHEPDINAMVIHFRNISSRKIFEEILQTSEEKYRNLFNTNPSSIFIWNPRTYQILEINDAAMEEYGYSKTAFLAMKMTDLLLPGQLKEFKQIAKAIADSQLQHADHVLLHKNIKGKVKYMDITNQVIQYFSQLACLSIAHDITEKIDLEKKLGEERRKKQQQITAAVITAQEKEREELGKELHDNINQILATSKLYIEYALENEVMRDTLLSNAKDFIETAVAELRNLSKTLSPPSLGEVGIEMALQELVESIKVVNKFTFHTEWEVLKKIHLSEPLQLTIFRIVQEQLNNIIKHAQAQNIWIKINLKNLRLHIIIRDDGKGFNLAARKTGVGLKNIHSRAELHNGIMQLKSEPGQGFEMSLLFNIEKPPNRL
ncbi:MAG: PAS domain S-box protein [Ferruginibacter sp.]